jgi:hypothetical protein
VQVTQHCGSAQREWESGREERRERRDADGKVKRIKERRRKDRGREKLNQKKKQKEGKGILRGL